MTRRIRITKSRYGYEGRRIRVDYKTCSAFMFIPMTSEPRIQIVLNQRCLESQDDISEHIADLMAASQDRDSLQRLADRYLKFEPASEPAEVE